jgi:hypothetical protein
MSLQSRLWTAGLIVAGAVAVQTAYAQSSAAPAENGPEIARPHGPLYPDLPALRTGNPMQEPIGPDVFWRQPPRPMWPVTMGYSSQP